MAASMAAGRNRMTMRLALTGLLTAFAVAGLAWWGHGGGAQGWQMAARYTARLSFALFVIVFLVRPLAPALGTARAWLGERRGLGLAFAGAHFVHLAALTGFFLVTGIDPNPVTVIFGGFGYVLLAAMALTSSDGAVRALGPARWRLLHRAGLLYLWFIFTYTYLGRVQRSPDMVEYWVLLASAVGAMAIRLGAAMQRRRRAVPA